MTTPNFPISHEYFLDRTTIVYGPSGSGKSTIIADILYYLKDHIAQIVVVCPTDKIHKTYSSGLVPPLLIHHELTQTLLDNIWERQEALTQVAKLASDIKTLQSILQKTPGHENILAAEKSIRNKLEDNMKPIKDNPGAEEQINKMRENTENVIIALYKNHIKKHRRDLLPRTDLTDEERIIVKNIDINPRLILILDDCTDQLNKLRTHRVIKQLFFQGRWARITALFGIHSDTTLSPELKQGAFVNIFTTKNSALTYFDRASTNKDKELAAEVRDRINEVYTHADQFQKLVWVRLENKFYKYTATPRRGFKFGSPIIWKFCDMAKRDDAGIDRTNRFIKKML